MGELRIPYLLDEDKEDYASLVERLKEVLIKVIEDELSRENIIEDIERKNLLLLEELVEYNKEKLTNLQQEITTHIMKLS